MDHGGPMRLIGTPYLSRGESTMYIRTLVAAGRWRENPLSSFVLLSRLHT